MALTDTPWIGGLDDKLYLQSGTFTATLKTSQAIGSVDISPYGVSWDGTNTPWCGFAAAKLYLTSGQFTSTLKTSQDVSAVDTVPSSCSWDSTNTPWTGWSDDKLYLTSGQFTSTIKTSQDVTALDDAVEGGNYDGTNTPWCGWEGDKLYLQSGQYTATLKTSLFVGATNTQPRGVSYNGTDTLWAGDEGIKDKLYLQSGQFASTVKTSVDISAIDTSPSGIDTNDWSSKMGLGVDVTVLPNTQTISAVLLEPTTPGLNIVVTVSVLTLSGVSQAPLIAQDIVISMSTLSITAAQKGIAIQAGNDIFINISSPLALSLTQGVPTVSGTVTILRPNQTLPVLESALSTHAPTINITNDKRTLVANTRNFAISEYARFAFNSMCKFNGKYLYAKSDGIYEAGGDDDNGIQIDASYKTGSINTYTTEIQRLRDAYLTFRSNGDVQFFSVGDDVNTRAYYITLSTASTIHERRVKFERGIKNRHFNIGISNVNGSTLEVDSIKILTEPIRKRR